MSCFTWKGHDWMSRLPGYLLEMPLNMLAIPGSNNSYSYAFDPDVNADRASDPIYRHFVKLIDELAVTVSQRWSVTQSLSLKEQLNLGVRYLDLRVTSRPKVEEVYIRNGPNIINALLEINHWLDKHPTEVIIIEFTETVQMSPAQHKRLLAAMTREIFGSKLLDYTGNLSRVNIRNMLGVEAQVIVLYPKEYMFGYTSIWPRDFIDHTYSDAQAVGELIEQFETRRQHGRPSNVFYCWKGALTPTLDYIENHLTGDLEGTIAKPTTNAVGQWVKSIRFHDGDINIVVADFVERSNFCRTVVELNTRVSLVM